MMTTIGRKIFATIAVTGVLIGVGGGVASAHVVVKPAEVETATFQTFTTSVPSELKSPTVKVRVVVPGGVKHVTPTVKPGWTISEVKDGEGENAIVKEITWSGGEIPSGQRDEFSFSAQVPAAATTLQWKAYQTYGDGTEVAWDKAPAASKGSDDEGVKPYSETKVVDNLSNTGAATTAAAKTDDKSSIAMPLSILAIVLSVLALNRGSKAAKPKSDKAAKVHKASRD
jgi:uncharacterized protein YcnI